MTRKLRWDAYDGNARGPRGPVVSSVRSDAPRLEGFAESLKSLGVTHLAGEEIDTAAIEIGEQIREARQRRRLSQSQLAQMIGCNQGDLSNIERGKGKDGPSYRTLRDLARALDVEIPINRRLPSIGTVVAHASETTGVFETATSFNMLAPLLFSDEHWRGVCKTIYGVVDLPTNLCPSDTCHLISVESKMKVLLRADSPGTIISTVRRQGGFVHTHNARHRFKKPDPGEPLAILEENGEVEVHTDYDESMTLIMYPAEAVIARFCEDGAE